VRVEHMIGVCAHYNRNILSSGQGGMPFCLHTTKSYTQAATQWARGRNVAAPSPLNS